MRRAENDPRAPFEQLADDLRIQIRSGEIEPGQKLPSVRELIEQSGFVSATVQKSLALLRNEGWITTTGRGSFARDPNAPSAPIAPVTEASFAELQTQVAELAKRVQALEERLADGSEA